MENNFVEFKLLNGNTVKYNKNLVSKVYYNLKHDWVTIHIFNKSITYVSKEDVESAYIIYKMF